MLWYGATHIRESVEMSIEQMRIKLHSCAKYPVGDWNDKVYHMSDKQVHGTYMRLMNAGWIK